MADRKRRTPRAKPAKVVQTQRLEIVDASGHVAAVLGALPGAEVDTPGVGLVLYDSNGERRLLLSCDTSGPSIHLMAGGTVVVSLGVLDTSPAGEGPSTYLHATTVGGRQIVQMDLAEPRS
jgi:hypothetical protein